MPADRRTGAVLVDQGHGERASIDAAPVCNGCAHGEQERWNRFGGRPIVRLAKERHSPPSDHPAHLEVRKCDIGDRFEEDSFVGVGDEVRSIVEAWGPLGFEESPRHD